MSAESLSHLRFVESWFVVAGLLLLLMAATRLLPRGEPIPRRARHWHNGLSGTSVMVAIFAYSLIFAIVTRLIPPQPDETKAEAQVQQVIRTLVAFPFQLIAFLVVRQLGLIPAVWSIHRPSWRERLRATVRAWWLATPLIFVLHWGVTELHGLLFDVAPEEHPWARVLSESPSWLWLGVMFIVLVRAPTLEEIFFRGMLLPWMLKRGDRSDGFGPEVRCWVIFLLAAGATALARSKDIKAWANGDQSLRTTVDAILPLVWISAMAGMQWLAIRWRGLARTLGMGRHEVMAVVSNSTLFAAIHASVWPTPVPLWLLSVVIGIITVRTRSVVPAIVFHSAFNAISCFAPWLASRSASG